MATTVRYSKILLEAGKAIGIALVINVALFMVFFSLKLIDPHVPVSPDGQGVTVGAVAISTIIGLSVATGVFLLLARFTNNAAGIFTWVCIVVFVLVLANPFLAGMPTGMALALDALHIAPAYLIWRFLTRSVA